MNIRALCLHHHMGDITVHEFVILVLESAKADGAIVDYEFLAASRTAWMELGVFSVDVDRDQVQILPSTAFGVAMESVEGYLSQKVFGDEVLVQGIYML